MNEITMFTQRKNAIKTNGWPKLLDLSNRVKFLNQRHSKIDKNMISYINLLQRTNDGSKDK